MYTIIINTVWGIKSDRGDSISSLINYAEGINSETPYSVYWYTVVDTETGAQVDTYLINEGAPTIR
jgi:hypothetical protein